MILECCSKQLLEFEIKNRIKSLGKGEGLEIKITPCNVLDGAFDLELKGKFVKLEKKRRKSK